jgi:hypothetical protein
VLGSLVGGSATVATTLAHWQNFSAAGRLAANSPYGLSSTLKCGMPRRYAEARNRVFHKRQFRTDGINIKTLTKRCHNMSESDYGD